MWSQWVFSCQGETCGFVQKRGSSQASPSSAPAGWREASLSQEKLFLSWFVPLCLFKERSSSQLHSGGVVEGAGSCWGRAGGCGGWWQLSWRAVSPCLRGLLSADAPLGPALLSLASPRVARGAKPGGNHCCRAAGGACCQPGLPRSYLETSPRPGQGMAACWGVPNFLNLP